MKLLQAWPLTAVAILSIFPALSSLGYWFNVISNFSTDIFHNVFFLLGQLFVIITFIGGVMLLFGSKKSIIFYILATVISTYLFYKNFPFHGLIAVWNGHEASSLQLNNLRVMAQSVIYVFLKSIIFLVVVIIFSKNLQSTHSSAKKA